MALGRVPRPVLSLWVFNKFHEIVAGSKVEVLGHALFVPSHCRTAFSTSGVLGKIVRRRNEVDLSDDQSWSVANLFWRIQYADADASEQRCRSPWKFGRNAAGF